MPPDPDHSPDEHDAVADGQRQEGRKHVLVAHPALIALYPVLGLFAENAGRMPFAAFVRPALLFAGAATALWCLLWLIIRDRYRAGVAASVLVFAALSGWNLLEMVIARASALFATPSAPVIITVVLAGGTGLFLVRTGKAVSWRAAMPAMAACAIGTAAILLVAGRFFQPVWGAGAAWLIGGYMALALVAAVLLTRLNRDYRSITRMLNGFGVVLILLSGANIALHRPTADASLPPATELEAPAANGHGVRPDIYVLALDGYSRADVLRSQFGYNNLPFLERMTTKGFTVFEDSRAAHASPALSMTACLNMEQPDALIEGDGAVALGSLEVQYHHNRMFQTLKKRGYELVVFSPGLNAREPQELTDLCLKPRLGCSEFETVLLGSTCANRLYQAYTYARYGAAGSLFQACQRKRAQFVFDQLSGLAPKEGAAPRLVFAHLTLPDEPFLFGRNGGWPQTLPGGDPVSGVLYRQLYTEQLHYASRQIERALDQLMANTERPSAVVVYSSTGASRLGAEQRQANFVMVRWPGNAADADLAAGPITLDRLFPLIFGRLFDGEAAAGRPEVADPPRVR